MQIREATAADRDAILALRERCFDVDAEKRDPRFWDWEFRDARCFVAEEQGRIVSHLALVRMPGRSALAVDAMTAPEARGKGVFSQVVAETMRAAREEFDYATAYQIRSGVLGAMLRGGWGVAEKVPVLVRPILWSGPLPGLRPPSPRSAGRGAGSEGLPLHFERSPEFLQWRFFENPLWKYDVTAIDDAAYLVARRTTLKGIDTYAIADLAFKDKRAAGILLRNAIAEAKRLGCRLAAALVSRHHPAFWLFVRHGFLPGPHRFRLLVYPPQRRRWSVMWADTDHL